MNCERDYSDYSYSSDDEYDAEFDCYDDYECGAKAKRCTKANAGIKTCVKKVKGGLSGMSKAMNMHK